mmetsp:Transcript_43882/g.113344  ORF Transcript_43882/g.113344 Transcript_43882/m.113344 type:complete len:409 (-) Transcript_43882:132-1358(-)|eukprot:CAMPEP_0195132748 /NCGR_PEP_ID=MMETSP0448-20130528/147449_1 /TAXON_ID=66468 /ORGANISM="Heterocapsa triquestra, Strain CCMP 448" /LENGTH=408 /DNA_ID=CAMNT_0040170777 /DNA_START=44 /DNA_END=1270 /DNA_ORIENTATION=-
MEEASAVAAAPGAADTAADALEELEGPAAEPAAEQAGAAPVGAQNAGAGSMLDYDPGTWEPEALQYGLAGLLRLREAMLPIPKPHETAHLKFLIYAPPDTEHRAKPAEEARKGEGAERKGPIKSKQRGKERGKGDGGGRNVQGMGKTELLPNGPSRGQWWRNAVDLDVIVREDFAFASAEIAKVPPGHYVQQAGPIEVFVSGQASGLQRMPVFCDFNRPAASAWASAWAGWQAQQPLGWATVDATLVGGPKYLEMVCSPRWKVVFSSGSRHGDIVVREGKSLDSDEVGVLMCGTFVEQRGPQEVLEDGIVRMPIQLASGVGREPSASSQPPRQTAGWVTVDATAQGGPKFFEPFPEEGQLEPTAQPPHSAETRCSQSGDAERGRNGAAAEGEACEPRRALPETPWAPG